SGIPPSTVSIRSGQAPWPIVADMDERTGPNRNSLSINRAKDRSLPNAVHRKTHHRPISASSAYTSAGTRCAAASNRRPASGGVGSLENIVLVEKERRADIDGSGEDLTGRLVDIE